MSDYGRELREIMGKLATRGMWEDETTGRLGKPLGSGQFEIDAEDELGHVLVNTDTGIVKALNAGVPRLANIPVRLSRNPDGILLAKPDWLATLKFLGDTAQTIAAAVMPHSHRLGSGLDDDVEGLRIIPGRVRVYSGLIVYIDPFPYRYGGAEVEFLGGTLDLTSYQGATAGTWRFVKVGVDPATNTPIGVAGGDYLQIVPLDRQFLDDIDFTDYLPCGAVRLRESDTSIVFRDAFGPRFEDCRIAVTGGDSLSTTDHNSLSNLTVGDVHTQYALKTIVAKGLFDHYADVSVGGAEADIFTNTLVAGRLAANGEKIIASYGGNFATLGTETVQLKAYFAGTAIWDSTGIAVTTGTTSWAVAVEVIRVSSSVVRFNVRLNTSGASGFVYNTVGELTGLTLANTAVIKITGTSSGVGSGTGDIVGKMGYGEWKPAA